MRFFKAARAPPFQSQAAIDDACCGATAEPMRTVAAYSRRLLHEGALLGKPLIGKADDPPELLSVTLHAKTRGRTIQKARFRASHCMTLTALAEALCERLEGMTVEGASRLQPRDLTQAFSDIPDERAGRAALLIRAVQDMTIGKKEA